MNKEFIRYFYWRLTLLDRLRWEEVLNESNPPFEEKKEYKNQTFEALQKKFSAQNYRYKVTVLADGIEPELEIEIVNTGSLHLDFKDGICCEALFLTAADNTPDINDSYSPVLAEIESIYHAFNEFMKTGKDKDLNLRSKDLQKFFIIKEILSRNWKFKQKYTDYIV